MAKKPGSKNYRKKIKKTSMKTTLTKYMNMSGQGVHYFKRKYPMGNITATYNATTGIPNPSMAGFNLHLTNFRIFRIYSII